MPEKTDIEKIKELSNAYKKIARMLDKIIKVEQSDLSEEEKNKKMERLAGDFMIACIKTQKMMEGM